MSLSLRLLMLSGCLALAPFALPSAAGPYETETFANIPVRVDVPACEMPAAQDGDEIVFVSAAEGTARSSVSVIGEYGRTDAATLVIEPGDTPLYIYAVASKPIVWRVVGATDRVRQFVTEGKSVPILAPAEPEDDSRRAEDAALPAPVPPNVREVAEAGGNVGVYGLPSERVAFMYQTGCIGFVHEADNQEMTRAHQTLEQHLGRPADHVIRHSRLGTVQVPAGLHELVQTDYRRDFSLFMKDWNGKDQYVAFPSTVVMIRAEKVVAPGKVTPYTIYPARSGLNQLTEAGYLERLDNREYVILRTFSHFPADLTSWNAVKFTLNEGVEMPAGYLGGSVVRAAGSGECLSGGCN